jgi:glycosyltransferase involved in cell wall biosynthesis
MNTSTAAKISICIPAYNAPAQLQETLESIAFAARGRTDIEVVIRDDGSPSGDLITVVQPFMSRLRINYARQPQNLGFDSNVLSAVGAATGEYCWLMSDNDWLLPQAFDQLFAILAAHPQADYIYIDRINQLDEVPSPPFAASVKVASAEEFLLRHDYPGFISSQLIRRTLWDAADKEKYRGNLWIHASTIMELLPRAYIVRSGTPLIRARNENSWVRGGKNLRTFLSLKRIVADLPRFGYAPAAVGELLRRFSRDAFEVLAYAKLCGLPVNRATAAEIIRSFKKQPLVLAGLLMLLYTPVFILRPLGKLMHNHFKK